MNLIETADLAPRSCGCGGRCMLCDDDGLIYTEVKVLPNFRMTLGEAPDQWTGMVGRVLRVHGSELLVELGHHEVWIRRTRLQTQAEEVTRKEESCSTAS